MWWWQLKRRVHISWLIGLGCAMLVLGVWLASVISQGYFASVVWLILGLLLIAIACWRQTAVAILLVVFGGALIGLWRGSVTQAHLQAYQQLIGQTIQLQGVVREDVTERDGGQIAIRLSDVVYQNKKLPGTVWIAAQGDTKRVQRSDHVVIEGQLTDGFGNFAASMYRGQITKVERPVPGDVALKVRDWFGAKVNQVMPEHAASLGLGYLLGMRRGLPPELEENLRIVGLTHVIVASGFHLSTVVRFSRRWLMKLSRFSALAGSGFLMFGFIAVTGVSPSMFRAGLVTSLSLLAWYYGRKFHPLVIIPLVAAVTVLVVPSYAWRDVGWLLSFSAFAGVMVLAPLLHSYFFGAQKPNWIRQILGETVSAQIATLPILIITFGYVSNLSIVANLLVLPLVPLVMFLTLIAGLAAWIMPFAAGIIALPAIWLLEYMIAVVNYFAAIPWAKTEVATNLWFAAGYYLLLVAACVYMTRATKLRLQETNIVE